MSNRTAQFLEDHKDELESWEEQPAPYPDTEHHQGSIYFIRGAILPLTKVGLTQQPVKDRLKQFQLGSADILTCLHEMTSSHIYKTEAFLHKWLGRYRRHNEWFAIPQMFTPLLFRCQDEHDLQNEMEQCWLSTPVKKLRQ